MTKQFNKATLAKLEETRNRIMQLGQEMNIITGIYMDALELNPEEWRLDPNELVLVSVDKTEDNDNNKEQ